MKYHLLDPLRGIAALWVFAYHVNWDSTFTGYLSPIRSIFANGHLGVQMFFVISGFCLMSSLCYSQNINENPVKFIYRRGKRIYSTFWFSIIFVALLPFIIELISSLKTGSYNSPYLNKTVSYGFLQFSLLDWFKTISLLKIFESSSNFNWISDKFNSINGVYWSLAIEVQFYLVMFIALLSKHRANLVLMSVTILSLLITIGYPEYRLSGAFFYFWHYFALGIILNLLFKSGIKPTSYKKLHKFFKVLFFSITVSLIYLLLTTSNLNLWIFTVLFMMLLWLGEDYEELYLTNIKQQKFFYLTLNLLGLISYSLYLIHAKLILLVQMFVRQVLAESSFLFLPISFLITIFGCYVFYLFCEKPFCIRKVKN